MSDIGKTLRLKLVSDAAVTALVGSRIYPLTLPQGVTLPAIRYQRITGNSDPHLGGTTGLAVATVQLDCVGTTYAGAEQVRDAVRESLEAYQGTVSGVKITSVRATNHSDFYDAPAHANDVGLYQLMSDYEVFFTETAL